MALVHMTNVFNTSIRLHTLNVFRFIDISVRMVSLPLYLAMSYIWFGALSTKAPFQLK